LVQPQLRTVHRGFGVDEGFAVHGLDVVNIARPYLILPPVVDAVNKMPEMLDSSDQIFHIRIHLAVAELHLDFGLSVYLPFDQFQSAPHPSAVNIILSQNQLQEACRQAANFLGQVTQSIINFI